MELEKSTLSMVEYSHLAKTILKFYHVTPLNMSLLVEGNVEIRMLDEDDVADNGIISESCDSS